MECWKNGRTRMEWKIAKWEIGRSFRLSLRLRFKNSLRLTPCASRFLFLDNNGLQIFLEIVNPRDDGNP